MTVDPVLACERRGVLRATARWTSGSAAMHVNLELPVVSAEDALNLIRQLTTSAPLFRDLSIHEEQR